MRQGFVMLENNLTGMGGGQMYTRNKTVYMRQHCFDTFVFSGMVGSVIIKELGQYKRFIFPELASSPLVYSAKMVHHTVEKISLILEGYDRLIIESGSGHMALWGEILAKRLSCKHMVHLLEERNDLVVPEEYLDFYRFKLSRKELSGITQESLKMLFRYSSEINEVNSYALSSVCQNVVSDTVHFDQSKLKKNAITLCTIGRLEKKYVQVAAEAFCKVAKSHTNDAFNVIFVGGTEEKHVVTMLKRFFRGCNNVSLFFTGYIYPIPINLFDCVDVFVSSAGSAGVSYRQNRPTISVDGNDSKAIGVLGYTTQRGLYRDTEAKQDVTELIEKILYSDYLKEFKFIPTQNFPSLDVLDVHLDFLSSSSSEAEYYPVIKMLPKGKDKKKYKARLILGDWGYVRIRPLFAKILRLPLFPEK